MKLKKKKAFTLTELLVVVVVIGVLSAVVLPKFNKVMETRKTTEAEEIMAAIRTEQERRCALDKKYHGEMSEMADLLPETTTKYYAYNLTGTGVEAATTSNNKYSYTLVMPSYADGRIACEGADCSKLNKNYPSKDELLSKSDYQNTPVECNAWMECTGDAEKPCGWSGSGKQTRECDHTTGTWSAWSDCSEPPCDPSTEPTMSRPCGCKNAGTQTRVSEPVCDPNTHTWSEPAWGACSDTRTGVQCCGPSMPKSRGCGCNNTGRQTKEATSCNISMGTWNYSGSWSTCNVPDDCCAGKTLTKRCFSQKKEGTQTATCNSSTGELTWGICRISDKSSYEWVRDGQTDVPVGIECHGVSSLKVEQEAKERAFQSLRNQGKESCPSDLLCTKSEAEQNKRCFDETDVFVTGCEGGYGVTVLVNLKRCVPMEG